MAFEHPRQRVEADAEFSEREVGITHPDNDSYIRIRDNGDIEISAGGTAIILNARSGSITVTGDSLKVLTKKENGFRWNKLALNPQATSFNQATFIPFDENESLGLYRGVHYFLDT